MKNGERKTKKNEKDKRPIRIENAKRYKSNVGIILHTDATSPDVIAKITTVPERKSTGCLTDTVIWYGIIKKGNVVDVLPYSSTGNNIPEITGWVKKLDKCNNE